MELQLLAEQCVWDYNVLVDEIHSVVTHASGEGWPAKFKIGIEKIMEDQILELNIKKGELYHVELPMDIVPGLRDLPKEDYESYLSWHFKSNGLPNLIDVDCYFGFEIGSKLHFLDGWTTSVEEEPKEIIQKYLKEALEVLTQKGILEKAIEEHRKEL